MQYANKCFLLFFFFYDFILYNCVLCHFVYNVNIEYEKRLVVKMRGLDAKRVIRQKVKIEFLAVLCCHVVASSTLKVL